ncbi:FecR domain-containing protein [Aliifodinibius sp. S!AR15-10]|uniref:FecR family protein n=1 Tax=Aliifodinibius sp. S!AR15-10 TaxID=2950437 RepID=UPI0028585154|nr:FecR domain-containing protein [Aliifodinibius sp. S!AR15-10]MDR8391057.1 FecR domain-containing protein [Aliifodinibius sp. S!AR15-10]
MSLDNKYPKEIKRYVSGEYSPQDEEFVHEWLEEDPARKEVLKELQNLWEISGRVLELGNKGRAWSNIKDQIKKEKKTATQQSKPFPRNINRSGSSKLNIFFQAAAILLVVAGAYGFYLYSISSNTPAQTKEEIVLNTIKSEDDERVVVHIKDGSRVILNSSSQIQYRDDYGNSSRDIYLQGEAYFEVNHDHSAPFVVHAKDAIIEDIGTKFNVNANKEGAGTEVVVSEGKVRVSPHVRDSRGDSTYDKSTSSVIVSEGQKVSVKNNPDNLIVERADLYQALAWLQDRLIFDDEPLRQVIEQLQNHYGISVQVADSSLFNKYITGSFQDESVENVAKVLAISMDASYSLKDSTLQFFIEQQKINHFNNNR